MPTWGLEYMGQNILPKCFNIRNNTKKLEKILNIAGKCVDQVYLVEKLCKKEELKQHYLQDFCHPLLSLSFHSSSVFTTIIDQSIF